MLIEFITVCNMTYTYFFGIGWKLESLGYFVDQTVLMTTSTKGNWSVLRSRKFNQRKIFESIFILESIYLLEIAFFYYSQNLSFGKNKFEMPNTRMF